MGELRLSSCVNQQAPIPSHLTLNEFCGILFVLSISLRIIHFYFFVKMAYKKKKRPPANATDLPGNLGTHRNLAL